MKKPASSFQVSEISSSKADLPALLDVIRAAFEEQRGHLSPPSSSLNLTQADLVAKLALGPAFQAIDAQGPCGCVLTARADDHLYLGKLAVHPRARRQGLAITLMEAVYAAARAEGYDSVQLEYRIALTGNHALYQSQGFEIISEETHPGFDTPTFYRVSKKLA